MPSGAIGYTATRRPAIPNASHDRGRRRACGRRNPLAVLSNPAGAGVRLTVALVLTLALGGGPAAAHGSSPMPIRSANCGKPGGSTRWSSCHSSPRIACMGAACFGFGRGPAGAGGQAPARHFVRPWPGCARRSPYLSARSARRDPAVGAHGAAWPPRRCRAPLAPAGATRRGARLGAPDGLEQGRLRGDGIAAPGAVWPGPFTPPCCHPAWVGTVGLARPRAVRCGHRTRMAASPGAYRLPRNGPSVLASGPRSTGWPARRPRPRRGLRDADARRVPRCAYHLGALPALRLVCGSGGVLGCHRAWRSPTCRPTRGTQDPPRRSGCTNGFDFRGASSTTSRKPMMPSSAQSGSFTFRQCDRYQGGGDHHVPPMS
jgi:hypothetical protein